MVIAVCGSLVFHKEMRDVQKLLELAGHSVFVPKSLDLIEKSGFVKPKTVEERLAAEAKYDFIREHFKKIEKSDAVLVINPTHHDIEGYIGGNTFLEIGIAFYLGKKIYLLNAIPKMGYELELASMHPILLHGDLSKI
jgi:nucleoside 2-deoxyribosyltransferase